MKRIFFTLIFAIGLFSCNSESSSDTVDTSESEELATLRSENRALKSELVEKDSVLNESIMLFNEIEENLAMINFKEDEIRFRTNDVELAEDGKQWILQEIQNINFLREDNQRKVTELNKTLSNKNLQIEEYQAMITNLMSKIQLQEEEIEIIRVLKKYSTK